EKIVEEVDPLMRLKVIFLGYLRQLHQADQAYTRRLLEDKALASDELDKFSGMIEQTMRCAVDHLSLVKPRGLEGKISRSNALPSEICKSWEMSIWLFEQAGVALGDRFASRRCCNPENSIRTAPAHCLTCG